MYKYIMGFKDYLQDYADGYFAQDGLTKKDPIQKCPENILNEIRSLKNTDYVTLPIYHHVFPSREYEKKYPFPYPLINCDADCRKKLDYKSSVAKRTSPFVKKNEDVLEESKNTTNKTYTFLYIWFIIMVVVIYVLIIALVSENSYHPLMNIIIFIFLLYMSYYLYNNLSL
jgi:hypothetical protein